MTGSYDLEAILAQVWQWRHNAAATDDLARRDEWLSRAARYEHLVKRSIETAPIQTDGVIASDVMAIPPERLLALR